MNNVMEESATMPVESPPAGSVAGQRQKKPHIVAAATTVLSRQGYSETSLKEIAREAGVAPGLLHYYFASKEELLLEVVQAMDRELASSWQETVRGIDDPLERLMAAFDAAEVRCAQQPELGRLLLELSMLGLSNPEIHRRCRELRGRVIDAIEAELRQVLGSLPAFALVPPRELAGAVAGALDGVAMSVLIEEREPGPQVRAIKVMLMSFVVTAFLTAGQEPPLQRLGELLNRPVRRAQG